MDFSKDRSKGGRSPVGVIFVIVFHIALVYALMMGLGKKIIDVIKPTETKVIEEVKKPPPPPPEIPLPPPPKMAAPPPPYVPPPEVQIANPPAVQNAITATAKEPPTNRDIRPQQPVQPVPVAKPGPATVNSTCSKAPKLTEMPATNYVGEAEFKVRISVKNNKIADVSFVNVNLKSGSDRKAQRAFQAAIESQIRDQYLCQGTDVVFEQEFVFKVD